MLFKGTSEQKQNGLHILTQFYSILLAPGNCIQPDIYACFGVPFGTLFGVGAHF